MSTNQNKKLSYKLDKYVSSNLSGNTSNFINRLNPPTVVDRNKSRAKDHNLREREEGFSVYLMGANEERMKNMRKKEQIEKNKIRSNNNSRSIATRKKWDAHNSNVLNILNQGSHNRDKGSLERIYEKESRSKSRHNEVKSAGVDYKVVSKMILGDGARVNNSGSKQIVSKESLSNLEEMIMNINSMKLNVASNLNKIESPMNILNDHSSGNNTNTNNSNIKRNRNAWGEPKYGVGIVYPEYSSSVEHSNERLKKSINPMNKHLKIEINDNTVDSPTVNNEKHSSSNLHINHIEELENYEDEMDIGNINNINQLDTLGSHRTKDDFEIKDFQELNLNINDLNLSGNNQDILKMMKSSSTSLKLNSLHKNPQTMSKDNIINNSGNNLSNFSNFNKDNNPNTSVNKAPNKHFNFWKDGNKNQVTINNSTEMVNKKDILMVENLNNSDLLNISGNKIENNQNNLKTSANGPILSNLSSNILTSTHNVVTISPKKKLKSAHLKNRTKSVNKTKQVTNERPFSSIMNLSRLKSISGVTGLNIITGNQNSIDPHTKNAGKSLLSDNVLNQLYAGNINTNTPSIQFIYKSPQNKTKPQRPLSHIQKAKSNITSKNINNMPNIIGDRFSSREQMPYDNAVEMTTNTQVNFKKTKKKPYQNYPMISNIQQINKSNKDRDNKHFITQEKNNSSKETISASHSKKKFDILSKIEQLDEKKLSKLARVVEELANHPEEQSELLDSTEKLSELRKSKEIYKGGVNPTNTVNNANLSSNMHNFFFNNIKDKLNINYIKADSVNFGNININLNSQKGNEVDVEESPGFYPKDLDNSNKKAGSHNYSAAMATNPFKFNTKRSPSSSPISNYSVISIIILSTWGNTEKTGLTEVQIFDSKNKKIDIIECHVFNGVEDGINKISNNKFHTIDDNDMWSTPIAHHVNSNNVLSNSGSNTKESNNTNSNSNPNYTQLAVNIKIEIYFEAIHEVDKLIIWNYNGRDTSRGIKEIEVFKRNNFAWKGSVNKASYNLKGDYSTRISLKDIPSGGSNNANISNYTNNTSYNPANYNFELNNLLADSLDFNDIATLSPKRKEGNQLQLKDLLSQEDDNSNRNSGALTFNNTHNKNKITVNRKESNKNTQNAINIISTLNSARNIVSKSNQQNINNINLNNNNELMYERNVLRTSVGDSNAGNNFHNILGSAVCNSNSNNNTLLVSNNFSSNSVNCSRIKLVLTSNYGDNSYIGLTGIQFLDDREEGINIEKAESIGALPKDINTVFNNCGDPRIFENVFNNENEVTDDYYMWLTPFNPFSPPYIEIVFPQAITLSAIKFWNYNKADQLERGTRTIELILNENYHQQKTIILRKGLAEESIDYSQTILFPIVPFNFTEEELAPFKNPRPASLTFSQDFETPYLPTGFIFTLKLISTYGDPHYIGLNGVEFFDQLGNSVFKYNNPRVIAKPSGVHELSGMEEDTRYVNNLLNGFNSSQMGKNSWLCPFNNSHKAIDHEKNNISNNNTNSNSNNNSNSNSNYINFQSSNNILENTFSNFNMDNSEKNDNKTGIKGDINTNNENKPTPTHTHTHTNTQPHNNNTNTIYFIFDRPVSLSYIHFWNYSKKPERGVKEIHISCDDNIIYKGCLRKAEDTNDKNNFSLSGMSSSAKAGGFNRSIGSNFNVHNSTLILFTSDTDITKNINETLLTDSNSKNNYKFVENNSHSSYIMHIETDDCEKSQERPYTMEK